MKSYYYNYFKDKKLYQWDKEKSYFIISDTEFEGEFCLDKVGMDLLIKFVAKSVSLPKINVAQTLSVSSEGKKCTIKLIDCLLNIPNLDFTDSFKIDSNKLKTANKFVSSINPVLSGVYVKDGYVYSSDSFYAYKSDCGNAKGIIIPNQFIDLINVDGEIELKYNENIVAVTINDVMYIGRLLAGKYPNIETVFKIVLDKQVTASKSELKEMLSYSLGKNDRIIFSKNKVQILGEAELEFETKLDFEFPICVLISQLITTLNCIKDDEIKINFISEARPIKINNEYILLPLKLI